MSGKVREFDDDWRVATLSVTCSHRNVSDRFTELYSWIDGWNTVQ